MANRRIEELPQPDYQPMPGSDPLPESVTVITCPRCGNTDVTVKSVNGVNPVGGDVIRSKFCSCNNVMCQKRFPVTNTRDQAVTRKVPRKGRAA